MSRNNSNDFWEATRNGGILDRLQCLLLSKYALINECEYSKTWLFWNNCYENMLKSTALLHLHLSCPLKSFLVGSYYAADTLLKAAPTLEQKLNTLCNTTVQLHQWKTNRFQHSPTYHRPSALCSVSWSVTCCWHFLIPSCFQEKYAYKTTNNPMWDNPTARIHHSCSRGLPSKQYLSSAFERPTLSIKQRYLSEATTFASFVGKPLHVACETGGKGSQCVQTFPITNPALKYIKSFSNQWFLVCCLLKRQKVQIYIFSQKKELIGCFNAKSNTFYNCFMYILKFPASCASEACVLSASSASIEIRGFLTQTAYPLSQYLSVRILLFPLSYNLTIF